MARFGKDLLDGADLDEPSGVHHTDTVAELRYDTQVVTDKQHREAGVIDQPTQEIEDLCLYGYVKRCGRLVGEQELWCAGDRHGDHDALAHTAR